MGTRTPPCLEVAQGTCLRHLRARLRDACAQGGRRGLVSTSAFPARGPEVDCL